VQKYFLHYRRAFNSIREVSKYNLFTCPSAFHTAERGELKTALGPLNTYKEYDEATEWKLLPLEWTTYIDKYRKIPQHII
jgi:hypothetical protein